MIFKKIAAVAVVAAVTITAAAVLPVNAGTAGKAWVCAADESWDIAYWGSGDKNNNNVSSAVDAEITGDGVYTVSVEFEQAMDYGGYFALGTDFRASGTGENTEFRDYPLAELSVISVRADGKEISGNKNICDMNYFDTMAVFIYNPWENDKYNYTENLDWSTGIKSLEITFRINGLEAAEESVIPGEISTVPAIEVPVITETSTETAAEITSETTTVPPVEITAAVTYETTAETAALTETASQVTTASEAVPPEETAAVTTVPVTETIADYSEGAVNLNNEAAEETVPAVTESASEQVPPSDAVTDNVNTGNPMASGAAAAMAVSASAAMLSLKRKKYDNVSKK